ncbi:hypothetical protein [Brachybacterium sacelli]|uniref:DUF222 domain-containing protein n=1 Tax=Brachybacterium sacelli TaxID=173364 RepID=A0ABS4X3L8_9MICO|nr:hypothetical protein [Brachybacterium sacelli]MBP2382931.1 hypothetical protein [Brachybacterium sacelli]
MSALPTGPTPQIAGQDETHARIHALLTAVTAALLQEQPDLNGFPDHRPQRDRSSGVSWRGLETYCHVSALLASSGVPGRADGGATRLLTAADEVATTRGMRRRSESDAHGICGATWTDATGDLLEVIVGVRVAVRAVSAPFLPGSLRPVGSTSPPSPISPLTPPPRIVR